MKLTKKLGAEFMGTFWLVLGGCGSAVIAAAFPDVGIGLLGVAFAFGLTVLTMAFAIGHISGCHLNPAVSFGLWSGGRFSITELGPYIGAQVAGGIAKSHPIRRHGAEQLLPRCRVACWQRRSQVGSYRLELAWRLGGRWCWSRSRSCLRDLFSRGLAGCESKHDNGQSGEHEPG